MVAFVTPPRRAQAQICDPAWCQYGISYETSYSYFGECEGHGAECEYYYTWAWCGNFIYETWLQVCTWEDENYYGTCVSTGGGCVFY